MRITLRWLNEFLEPPITLEELLDLLPNKGIGISGVFNFSSGFDDFLIGEVIEVKKGWVTVGTPTLKITCDLEGDELSIGDKVAVNKKTKKILKKSDLKFPTDSVLVLEKEAPIGERLFTYLDDCALDTEITPNRADLYSVIGLAREVVHFTQRAFKEQKINGIDDFESDQSIDINLKIEDKEKCPNYIARVIVDLKVKPAPFFYQWRLFLCGLRPINNIVDATNYILCQYGQPLHPFDLKRLFGKTIFVRDGKKGETIKTIDGVERKISSDVLVIADAKRPIAIAGVIGGSNTEIIDNTKEVLLECAHFSQSAIRKGIKFLNLKTEASRRFELGIDPNALELSSQEATVLIAKWGNGKILKGKKEVRSEFIPTVIDLDLNYPKRILGVNFSKDFVNHSLTRLGMKILNLNTQDNKAKIEIPSYRLDISQPIDLVEEIARFYGYQNFQAQFSIRSKEIGRANPLSEKLSVIQNFFVGYGFNETITLSFVGPGEIISNNATKILNPLNERLAILRDNLFFSLLAVISLNHRWGNKNLRLFEIGKVYQNLNESYHLGIILTGESSPLFWQKKIRVVDFFDLKGIVENFFSALNLSPIDFSLKPHPLFKENISVEISHNNESIGLIGEIKEEILLPYEVETQVFYAEIFLQEVLSKIIEEKYFRPLDKFLPVMRDLSFIMSDKVLSSAVVNFVKREFYDQVSEVVIFDSFSGPPLPPEKKNLGIRLTLRTEAHSLTKERIDQIIQNIVTAIEKKFNTQLRRRDE